MTRPKNTAEKPVPVQLPIGQWVAVICTLVGFLVTAGWYAHLMISRIEQATVDNRKDMTSHYLEFQAFRQAEEDRWKEKAESDREAAKSNLELARTLERIQGKLDR